jgi:sRNA-binding carbon storage regulator CsrA
LRIGYESPDTGLKGVGIVLFLTRRLNLNLQTGDQFQITVVESRDGKVSLGISATNAKRLRKAIVNDDQTISAKQFGLSHRASGGVRSTGIAPKSTEVPRASVPHPSTGRTPQRRSTDPGYIERRAQG